MAEESTKKTQTEKVEKNETATEVEAKAAAKPKKKSKRRLVTEAKVYIQASFNNTIVSVTDMDGQVIASSSAGANGFKGPKKATPYAAQTAAEKALEKAKVYGVEKVHVIIKGAGNGRDQSIRGVNNGGVNVESITDITAVPHNGCRPRKSRRV